MTEFPLICTWVKFAYFWGGLSGGNSITVFSLKLPLVESLKQGRVPRMDMEYGGIRETGRLKGERMQSIPQLKFTEWFD